jgi:uncharacterized protein (DUF2147 family)
LTVCALGAGGNDAAARTLDGEAPRVVDRMFPARSPVIDLRRWKCATLPDRDGSTPAFSPPKAFIMSHPAFENATGRIMGLFVASLVLSFISVTALADGIRGTWLTEDGDAAFTITDCGAQLCGRIVWLESATDQSGSLRLDENNPDPTKQARRICGLALIRGFEPSGPDTWDGSVYNPQDGKTYSGDITVLSEDRLKLRAYIGLPIFGRGETWTRTDSAAADGIEYDCRSNE